MTKTPKRVLLACDALERLERLPTAIGSMARLFQAEVVLLNVVPPAPSSWRSEWGVDPQEVQGALIRARENDLTAVGRKLRGVAKRVEVRVGDPTTEIVKAAVDLECDIVALLDDPRLRNSERCFGTTTMKLLRMCPLPIWTVRDDSKRPARVMAAVDVGPEHVDLSRRILSLAQGFVAPRAAPLVVLHAWELWGEGLLAARGRMSKAELAAALEDMKRDRDQHVRELLAGERLTDHVVVKLVKGDASQVVPAMVRDNRIDLLVMGTLARTGLRGLVMGNTAERILHEVSCSILTVKPEGFVSPLSSLEPTGYVRN